MLATTPSETSEMLPASSTSNAPNRLAPLKSSSKKVTITTPITTVDSRLYRMAKPACPAICVKRYTGAIRVYSIVPSQRSHWIISLMLLNRPDRKRQTSVPISR